MIFPVPQGKVHRSDRFMNNVLENISFINCAINKRQKPINLTHICTWPLIFLAFYRHLDERWRG